MDEESDIIQEIRATRAAFAAAHGHDLHAMVAAYREMNRTGGWPVVRLAPIPHAAAARPATPPPPVTDAQPARGDIA